jgi:hypothetical protein
MSAAAGAIAVIAVPLRAVLSRLAQRARITI